ncbi:MAG: hypothetical protein Ct9H300mP25_13150 [Acidobacteriota bacterium]|nr:MAG: hypothetical protein Ct9H300mP25_13150 [Acidobacteriota bacterium]
MAGQGSYHAAQLDRSVRGCFSVVSFGADSDNDQPSHDAIEIFTTRIDTIYGGSFVLLAPEHPLVDKFATDSDETDKFRKRVKQFRELDRNARLTGQIEKEGFDTGRFAVNPFTKEHVPIWIANFVLADYGTGAIMSVPAHDQRDFEFARKYDLPIRVVIQPSDIGPLDGTTLQEASVDAGCLVESGQYSGLESSEARGVMTRDAEENGFGRGQVQYRLKDWGVSRQRYWGTPIPMIYCDKCGTQPVPIEDLPVELPIIKEFTGRGKSPLAQVSDFVDTTCPECGEEARRETDTMDTFVDSSWYFYRFLCPEERQRAIRYRQSQILGAH